MLFQDKSPCGEGETRPPLVLLRKLQVTASSRDRDGLMVLIAEAVRAKEPVLVFCASRKQCQSCAQLAADQLPGLLSGNAQVPGPTAAHESPRGEGSSDMRQPAQRVRSVSLLSCCRACGFGCIPRASLELGGTWCHDRPGVAAGSW